MADPWAAALRFPMRRARGEVRDGRPGRRGSSRRGSRGHLRLSYARREQVIDVLKAAFVQGPLAKDEFDLRVGQVLASRTYAELAPLTANIPAGLTRTQRSPERMPDSANRKADKAVACVTTTVMSILAVRDDGRRGNPLEVSPFMAVFIPFLVIADGERAVAAGRDISDTAMSGDRNAVDWPPSE
jgi:Domain of unknown function (DUF1707)